MPTDRALLAQRSRWRARACGLVLGLGCAMACAQGVVPQGVVPQGVVPQGVVPQGVASQGVASQDVVPQDVVPHGVASQGAVSPGMASPGVAAPGVTSPNVAAPSVAAQGEAPLGPGDVLRVTVYNNPDLTTEVEVPESGIIAFPLIGEVRVAGLAPPAAAADIARRLDQGGFIPDASVIVRVTESQSRLVAVLGEVAKPGNYPVLQASKVTDLLATAGGITERGASSVAIISKLPDGSTKRREVDLSKALDAVGGSKDLMVRPGDTVFVPPAPLFYIYGEVLKPGAYPLTPGLTLAQALSVGGGLTQRGTERGIRVERPGADGKSAMVRMGESDRLQPGDVVRVPESWF